MIAVAVKTDKIDTAVAPLFGKAKWFALIDEKENVRFWRNEAQNGRAVVDAFTAMHVKHVIFQDMGGNPFMKLFSAGISCYYAGEGRITLSSLLENFKARCLVKVTPENMMTYVEKAHKHSKGDHHEGHHHH